MPAYCRSIPVPKSPVLPDLFSLKIEKKLSLMPSRAAARVVQIIIGVLLPPFNHLVRSIRRKISRLLFPEVWIINHPPAEDRNFPMTTHLHTIIEKQLEKTRALGKETCRIIPWLFHRNGEPLKGVRRAWFDCMQECVGQNSVRFQTDGG